MLIFNTLAALKNYLSVDRNRLNLLLDIKPDLHFYSEINQINDLSVRSLIHISTR